MIVAVTFEDGKIFQHFGKTSQFKFYTVSDNSVTKAEVVGTEGKGHGELVGFLKEHGAEVLICGGLGEGAKNALSESGIKVYAGVEGETDQAIIDFVIGKLKYNPEVHCEHHHESEGEHSCHSGNC